MFQLFQRNVPRSGCRGWGAAKFINDLSDVTEFPRIYAEEIKAARFSCRENFGMAFA
jgi:hypothetical protein